MRRALSLAAAAALILSGGCGVVRDMRSEYVANRALRDAMEELASSSPSREAAEADLDLAYGLRPHDPRFLGRLAAPYQATGSFQRSLECYEASAGQTGADYSVEIGYCLLKLGETERGTELLEEALRGAARAYGQGGMSRARYANVLNDAGYGLVDAGVRLDEAFELIEEAVRIEPLNGAYIDSIGWAHFQRGDYEDAAFHLERAARLLPRDDPEILWHLGAVHARLGRYRRAESELRQALRLDPSNEEARRTLKEMLRELPPPVSV